MADRLAGRGDGRATAWPDRRGGVDVRALIATRPGALEIGAVAVPAFGARQLLIETRVSAVSPGSELRALFEGTRFPRVGGTGYMAAGVVRQVGGEVAGFAPGDAVQFTCSEPVG